MHRPLRVFRTALIGAGWMLALAAQALAQAPTAAATPPAASPAAAAAQAAPAGAASTPAAPVAPVAADAAVAPSAAPAAAPAAPAAAASGTPAAAPAPALASAPAPAPPTRPTLVSASSLNGADTTWLLTATALVMLMTLPGIALFYGGMVRRKSILNTMASVVGIAAVVTVCWFALGYSLAFTPGTAFIGSLDRAWFTGMDYVKDSSQVAVSHIATNVPESVYAMFQLSFAIITTALVVGAFVERMRFSAVLWFAGLWSLLVYAPVAHWVWEPGGWLAQMGALDFAGGSVVHINAGAAGLVCAWWLGPRRGYGREAFIPVNLGLTMAGTGLLWVGWYGFNAGSAVAADGRAGLALVATHMAAACGALSWMVAEWWVRRRPSLLGLCSGVVAGLVAVTPASGFVTPGSAAIIGLVAGLVCYWGATGLKRWLQADDSLDVFGVHGVGGIVGCLLTGVFASRVVSGATGSMLTQLIDALAVLAWSMIMTAVVLWIVHKLVGLRVDEDSELDGLDLSIHGEQVAH